MCSELNVYGIIAGVIGAAAILATTYVDKHSGDAHVAPPAIAKTVQVAPPVSIALGQDGVRVDINLSLNRITAMSCEVPDNMKVEGRRYTARMLGASLVYGAVIFAAAWLIKHSGLHLPLWVVVLVALTPAIPASLMVVTYLTFFRKMDEFNQRIQSEAWLIAAGVVGFGSFSYSFLVEWAHFPNLDLTWILPSLIFSWGVASFFVRRRYQ